MRGPAGVGDFIAQTQERFPGHTFALRGDVDAHHNQARFQWQAGPPEDPERFVGFDVIVCEGERIGQVLGFMDAAPPLSSSAEGGGLARVPRAARGRPGSTASRADRRARRTSAEEAARSVEPGSTMVDAGM